MNRLSDDILDHIFSFKEFDRRLHTIHSILMVNRKLNQAACRRIWRNIEFDGESQEKVINFANQLDNIQSSIRYLTLSFSIENVETSSFTFTFTEDFNSNWFRRVIMYLPQLKILKCSPEMSFDFTTFPKYFQHQELQYLNLHGCSSWLSKETLRYIGDIFPKLQSIILGPDSSGIICDKTISQLVYTCLDLSDITIIEPRNNLTDVGVLAISKFTSKRLKRLSITHSVKITEKSMEAISTYCQNIQYLDISGNLNFTFTALEKLFTFRLLNLKSLRIIGLSKLKIPLTFFENLLEFAPNLSNLSINASYLIPYRFEFTYGNKPLLKKTLISKDPLHPLLSRMNLLSIKVIEIFDIRDDECPSGFIFGILTSLKYLQKAILYKTCSEPDYILGTYAKSRNDIFGLENLNEGLVNEWKNGLLKEVDVELIETFLSD